MRGRDEMHETCLGRPDEPRARYAFVTWRRRLIEAACHAHDPRSRMPHTICSTKNPSRLVLRDDRQRGIRLADAAPNPGEGRVIMIQSIQRETIVEMLLNSLEAERYVRRPLLLNIVDELSGSDALAPAAEMARSLLSTMTTGKLSESDFRLRLVELRGCVQRLTRTGLVEASASSLARTTPRIHSGRPANAA